MASMLACRSAWESALRSVDRPEGSPTAPVAPPICPITEDGLQRQHCAMDTEKRAGKVVTYESDGIVAF